MLKSFKGASWFVYFKSEHLQEVIGPAVIFVGERKCVVNVGYNKNKRLEVERRLMPENSQTSQTKRMKVALDKTADENIKLRKDLLELRTNPQAGISQQMVVHLQSQIENLEAERREKMKEATAMKSLLEQQGLGSGDDLDTLVKSVAMSLEEGEEEKVKQTKWDDAKEEVASEAVEKKLEEEEEVAASSVKEGVEEEPKEGAEALVKVFLAGLSALMKNKK